jgi:ABC-type branched-chain amino acid transport systems, periplasmic component
VRRAYSRGLVAAAAASALLLSACGGNDHSSSGSGGSSGTARRRSASWAPRPAPNAQLGINISNGVELALQQHNAKSGVTQVKLIKYDTQGDPTQATNQAKKAVTDKVVAIVGPAFSGESKTADPIFEEAGIPNVSPSATNALWPRTAGSSGTACWPTTTCRARARPTSWPRPWARRLWPSSMIRATTARAWPTPCASSSRLTVSRSP